MDISIVATSDFHYNMKGRYAHLFAEEKIDLVLKRIRSSPADIFLFAGDLAMVKKIEEAKPYLEILASLPAKYKFMVPGNHDWWFKKSLLAEYNDPSHLMILSGNGYVIEEYNIGIAGIRGWYDFSFGPPKNTEPEEFIKRAEKIATRERIRLENALREMHGIKYKIVLMHFSPTARTVRNDDYIGYCGAKQFLIPLLAFEVAHVFHGHSHRCDKFLEAHIGSLTVHNVAMDRMDYYPARIKVNPEEWPPGTHPELGIRKK